MLLPLSRVIVTGSIQSKKHLLETLSGLFSEPCDTPAETLCEAFFAREKLGSTALGHQIALPHIRLEALDTSYASLILLKTPLAFDAPDGEPIKLALGLISPKAQESTHLAHLQRFATVFGDPKQREKLLESPDARTLHTLTLQYLNDN